MRRRLKTPSFDVLLRFAALYGCSLEYLMDYEGKRMIDIGDLTDAQAAAVVEMINQFRASNAALNISAYAYKEVI